jgi:MFS family permease
LAAFVASMFTAKGLRLDEAMVSGSQWAALVFGFSAIGVLAGGWFSDRVGRARAALKLVLTSGLCAAGFGFTRTAPRLVFIAFGCVYSLLIAADSPIYSTAILDFASPHQSGSAQAIQAFLGFGVAVIAPVAAGATLHLGVGWGGVFLLARAVEVLFVLPLLSLARREGRKSM